MKDSGGNHQHFDADGGEREDERALGLAEFDRETIGMSRDGDGSPKHNAKEPDEDHREQYRLSDVFQRRVADCEEDSGGGEAKEERNFCPDRRAETGRGFCLSFG